MRDNSAEPREPDPPQDVAAAALACPFASRAESDSLAPDDVLLVPRHRQVVTEYAAGESGGVELRLYYREKEISFDEPELFGFGEALARQSRFTARSATGWGAGYEWPRVRELLEALLEEGVLQRASAAAPERGAAPGVVPSPLPPARSAVARSWLESEAIGQELAGRPLELAYLELAIPVYRVAHLALDADGRQVGEANVYPPALRLDVETEWRICQYAGSRYQDERPMNVTALKSMVKHWKPMMVSLSRMRAEYLRRYPEAGRGWTVRDLQRLSSLVLAVPAHALMRERARVPNGSLHPVLSSVFRVTDGVRTTTNDMLFATIGGGPLPPGAPLTAAGLHAYAERNQIFLSAHGVCAGPRALIEEFLGVLMDGVAVGGAESVVLDAPVEAALAELAPAFDYGLRAIQAYCAVSSLLGAMARACERLLLALEPVSPEGNEPPRLVSFRARLERAVASWKAVTLWGDAARADRARLYDDMFAHAGRGLGEPASAPALSARIAPPRADSAAALQLELRARIGPLLGAAPRLQLPAVSAALAEYFREQQQIVRAAAELQGAVNAVLGRPAPRAPLHAADLLLHHRIVNAGLPESRHWPLLDDALEQELGLRAVVCADRIEIAGGAGA